MAQDNMEQVPSSKRVKTNSVIRKMAKTPRSVSITMDKEDVSEKDLCSQLTLSIMTALIELGIELDITIRENDESYEVILEE
jgi:hypothetical protein